jgi:hypothetical protein
MSALPPIPPGPLNSVERPWDYKNGWVRAPIREIVTNKSLTKQARLLWLMLASLKEGSTDYTWGDIEAELGCQTKARKNCLAQLVAQGFIEITEDGVVIIKDPYKAFNDNLFSVDKPVKTRRGVKFTLEVSELQEPEKPKPKKTQRSTAETSSTQQNRDNCAASWNLHKPGSFRNKDVMSADDFLAVKLHMENLNHDSKDIDGFMRIICKGIARDNWWLNTCNKKDFAAIFGSGRVQDKKRANVAKFYELGLNENKAENLEDQKPEDPNADKLANITYRLSVAKQRRDVAEIERWQKALNDIADQEESTDEF